MIRGGESWRIGRWSACAGSSYLHGTVRAHAAAYPDPTPPPTVQVLPANAAATPATHGVTQPDSTLPFTGTDAVVLLGFAGAVLVPGVGLLVVSRRNRHTVRPV